MKKNWTPRITLFAVVMLLITTALISGTFAKYTTAFTGTDTARVAKFDVDVTDGINTTTNVIDIFSTTDDGGLYDHTGTMIAPGSTSNFAIEVTSKSEVPVGVKLEIAETNTGSIPIYYTIGSENQRYSAVLSGAYTGGGTYQNLAAMATAIEDDTIIAATDGSTAATSTTTVNWAWSFEAAGTGQTDVIDTTLGEAGTAQVKLDVTVTATQLDTYTP